MNFLHLKNPIKLIFKMRKKHWLRIIVSSQQGIFTERVLPEEYQRESDLGNPSEDDEELSMFDDWANTLVTNLTTICLLVKLFYTCKIP